LICLVQGTTLELTLLMHPNIEQPQNDNHPLLVPDID
jgi:hypothetical protein